MDPKPGFDTARLHLRVLGQERVCEAPLPMGVHPLKDLLPAARAFSHEHVQAATQRLGEQGKTLSCRSGCAACCRHMPAISQIEALALVETIEAMEPERQARVRQRFADAIAKMEAAGLLNPDDVPGERGVVAPGDGPRTAMILETSRRYFALQIPCPFLEEEACSIYEERPLVCREYHVTSPAADCARHFEATVEELRLPVRMADIVTDALDHVAGIGAMTIPLVLALEWVHRWRDQLSRTADGIKMFETLLGEMDRHFKKAGG